MYLLWAATDRGVASVQVARRSLALIMPLYAFKVKWPDAFTMGRRPLMISLYFLTPLDLGAHVMDSWAPSKSSARVLEYHLWIHSGAL